MSLTKVTRTVVDSISSFLGINNTTGAITSVIPDLMPSNSTLYPSFACRAWVNFDGTRDSTGASNTNNTNRFIRGSGNVTSVLRNGTGDYTITFTTAMPDANYVVTWGGSYLTTPTAYTMSVSITTLTISSFKVQNRLDVAGYYDFQNNFLGVFR